MMELALSVALFLAAPPVEAAGQGPIWRVDEGDLVVAWGEALDPAWLGPVGEVKRPSRRLRSVARALEVGKLPPELRGLLGATVALWTETGERCEAKVEGLRVRCLATSHGVVDDDGVCRDVERSAEQLCEHGRAYLLGTLVPARPGESLCDARLATPSHAAPLRVFRPEPANDAADAEVLAAFRATRWWKATHAAYLGMDHDAASAARPWDSFGSHRPAIGRFSAGSGDAAELAFVASDLSTDADGGAPTQRLAAVFARAPGGAWRLHRAYWPGPTPAGFFAVEGTPLAELRAWGRTSLFALRPGPDAPQGASYEDDEFAPGSPEELLDFAIPDLSDPACGPR